MPFLQRCCPLSFFQRRGQDVLGGIKHRQELGVSVAAGETWETFRTILLPPALFALPREPRSLPCWVPSTVERPAPAPFALLTAAWPRHCRGGCWRATEQRLQFSSRWHVAGPHQRCPSDVCDGEPVSCVAELLLLTRVLNSTELKTENASQHTAKKEREGKEGGGNAGRKGGKAGALLGTLRWVAGCGSS